MNQQIVEQQPLRKGKKVDLFQIVFVGIVLILLFGTLNYFNILSISNLLPNQFGSLPRKDVPTGTSQQSQQLNNVAIKQLKISCPSVKEFCEKGEGILKEGTYVGIGYKLSSGSPIFAAFDGNLTATKSAFSTEIDGKPVKGNFKTIYLDNPNSNLRAIYYLKGPIIKSGKVNKGEQIATANGKPIAIYNNNSLIFSLIPGYPTAVNTPAILNKEDFE